MITTTTTTLNNKNDLQQTLNISSGTSLSYNSSIENIINTQGGTVLYSYDNIIIASEITDAFYNELYKNPYIEYIESVPLKKYGDLTNIPNNTTIYTITGINTGTDVNAVTNTVTTSGYTNSFIEGVNMTGYTNVITDYINTLNTYTTTLQDGVSGKTTQLNINKISPIITNNIFSLTGDTLNSFEYNIISTGTKPIKYEIITPSNYTGKLILDLNKIIGTPDKGGIYTFIIKAINYYGSDSKELVLSTTEYIKILNTNLTILNTLGSLVTYQILANGNPTSYSATSLPSGLSINTITGVISGVCTSTGTTTATISASGTTGIDTKELVIIAGNKPIITSLGTVTGKTFIPFNYDITSTVSNPTYIIIGDLPSGLSFKRNNISGYPTTPGISNIKIKTTNDFGESTKDLVITITNSSK